MKNARRLPAGHSMLVEADGNIRIDAWWNTLDHMPEPRPSVSFEAAQRCTAGNCAKRRPDNAFIESFNGKFGAECLNARWFMSLDDARRKMRGLA